ASRRLQLWLLLLASFVASACQNQSGSLDFAAIVIGPVVGVETPNALPYTPMPWVHLIDSNASRILQFHYATGTSRAADFSWEPLSSEEVDTGAQIDIVPSSTHVHFVKRTIRNQQL